MILWLKGLTVIKTRMENRRFRPQSSVHENPSGWWKYGINAVLNQVKPHRYSEETALHRVKDNVEYVNLFQKILMNLLRL